MIGIGYRQLTLHGRVTMSLDTFSAVWRHEGMGEPHHVLVDAAYWMDDDERRQAWARAVDELNQRGLVARGNLDPGFLEALRIVGRPSVEYYGWIAAEDRDIAVLVGSGGDDDGVLLIRDHQEVHLEPVGPEGMLGALIGQMPQVPAGRGRGVNLPSAEVQRLAKTVSGQSGAVKLPPADEFNVFGRPSMVEDAREWFEVMTSPRTGGGELFAAARNQYGERKRCEHGLRYVDTQKGRWFLQWTGSGKPGDVCSRGTSSANTVSSTCESISC